MMVELGALVGDGGRWWEMADGNAVGLAESCDDREVVTVISIDTI